YSLLLPHMLAWIRSNVTDTTMVEELTRRDGLAVEYARILIVGSIFTMAARGVAQYFYGMHRPGIVLLAVCSGNVVNLVLNTMLIFGPHAPTKTGWPLVDGWFDLAA